MMNKGFCKKRKEGPWLNTWQNQTPVASFCGHLFVYIYQSLNLQFLILLLPQKRRINLKRKNFKQHFYWKLFRILK